MSVELWTHHPIASTIWNMTTEPPPHLTNLSEPPPHLTPISPSDNSSHVLTPAGKKKRSILQLCCILYAILFEWHIRGNTSSSTCTMVLREARPQNFPSSFATKFRLSTGPHTHLLTSADIWQVDQTHTPSRLGNPLTCKPDTTVNVPRHAEHW